MKSGRHPLWIFGYGSLVWRPDFPHVESVPAWISGYERRFWQASTDHRGTPARPGRVATLVEAPGVRCRGVAYRIAPQAAADVFAYLDHREKNGYLGRRLSLDLDDGRRTDALTYIADPRGEHFAGPAPLLEIARQIQRAEGPSGANVEYVVRLAAALRRLGAPADETFELDAMLRRRATSGP